MIEKWTTPIPKLSGREGRTVYVYVPDEAQENPALSCAVHVRWS